MVEITNKNFEEKFPEIVENIRAASFLSIDCEFSGINEAESKGSLFDSADQIFYKKQKNIENYLIVEFGLSTFTMDKMSNNFNVASYSFYLLPFVNHKKSSKMTWELSSVDFLCTYNFNFNKVFYDGVSFIRRAEEEDIMDMIDQGTIGDIFNLDDIRNYKSQVCSWLPSAAFGEELILNLEGKHLSLAHVLQFEIRKDIPNAWTRNYERNIIKVRKISAEEKSKLLNNKKEKDDLMKKLFDSIWGFSRILYEIEELRKPIVGHNVLVDLMLIYLQFYGRKSLSYSEFKKRIHYMFPCIYDTKILCNALQTKIPRDECWPSTRLSDLYSFFKGAIGSTKFVTCPNILSKEENYSDSENFHDAGFDSYCTGYCFVKMAYMHLMWDEKKKIFSQSTVSKSFTSLMASINHLENLLYVPRSKVKWIDLNGSDPKKNPPVLLLVCSKTHEQLDITQIVLKLSDYYSADFKPINRYSGIIAISNKQHAKEIRSYFEGNEDYSVSDYSFLKHSFWGKALIRGFFVSAFLVITSKVLRVSKMIRLD